MGGRGNQAGERSRGGVGVGGGAQARGAGGVAHLRRRPKRDRQGQLAVRHPAEALGCCAGARLDGRERQRLVVRPARPLMPARRQLAARREELRVGELQCLLLAGHPADLPLAHRVSTKGPRTAGAPAAHAALRAAPPSSGADGRLRRRATSAPPRLLYGVHGVDAPLSAMHWRSPALHRAGCARCAHHSCARATGRQALNRTTPTRRQRAREHAARAGHVPLGPSAPNLARRSPR